MLTKNMTDSVFSLDFEIDVMFFLYSNSSQERHTSPVIKTQRKLKNNLYVMLFLFLKFKE